MTAGDWLDEFVPQTGKRVVTVLDASNIRPRDAYAPRLSAGESSAQPMARGLSPMGVVALAGVAGFVLGRMLGR